MDLSSPISDLPKIGPIFAKKFEKLGVDTVEDLFYHVPTRYLDYSNVTTISRLRANEIATIHAKVVSLKNIYSKRGLRMQIGSVEDETGKITVVWFNQPFLIKTLYPGRLISVSGKVGFFNRKLCLTSPDYELLVEEDDTTMHTGRLVPVYSETSGLSSKWIRRKMKDSFESVEIKEYVPSKILTKNKLIDFRSAIDYVHFPKSLDEAEVGRQRLAFNEVLNLEIKSQIRKLIWEKNKLAHKIKIDKKLSDSFIEKLPFTLTESQLNVIKDISKDMSGSIPMNRLLEGDVGSGKTVVAAFAMFTAFANGFQSVIMAPTQILAAQHYETLKKIFEPFNVRVSLITSNTKNIAVGRTDIFVGTHSLINGKINFNNVALVVIDEQHRFGVEQRKQLIKKSGVPHVLTMTATPIPRTVALTTYGDMDLSILKDMPKGRRNVLTWVIPEEKREKAYKWIEKEIKEGGNQAFIVCPLIEDSETETLTDVKSVTSEFEKLKKVFPKLKLSLLHGRLKSQEKDQILNDFKNKRTDILVTTPVVEVGIDIPNATIMVIEAGERFGLASLHQLRGRVGRGELQSYCLLFTNFHSGVAYTRLKAMEKTHSGFELAELDLKLRGPGEIFGTVQSGYPELKIANWSNYDLIKAAKEASEILVKDKTFVSEFMGRIANSIKQ